MYFLRTLFKDGSTNIRKHLLSRARLSSAKSLQLIRLFPDLAFGLLFQRFKTIFDRMKTVYRRDRNQQM